MLGKKNISVMLFLSAAVLSSAAYGESPYTQPDDTWISIDGEVTEVNPGSFVLDYGEGVVTVEMDDGDRDADGYKLIEGDKVSVSGIVDDDFYEIASIEASSVYVESLGTYFYASSVDEEDSFVTIPHPLVTSSLIVQGTVSSVSENEFTIDTGLQKLTVEVDEMAYNPLDEEGYQEIGKGDLVSITGTLDNEFFDGRVLNAESVVTLEGKKESS